MTEKSAPDSELVGLTQAKSGRVRHHTLDSLLLELTILWGPTVGVRQPSIVYSQDAVSLEEDFKPKEPPKRPPPWYIGMTPAFRKDIENMDKKLQGRILEVYYPCSRCPF